MLVVAKIDDETVGAEDFVKILKFNDSLDSLLEDVVGDKLTVHAARKRGISVSEKEVQEKADHLRRVLGLHRMKDTLEYLEASGLTVDEFAGFIEESLFKEKMIAEITTDEAIEEYFRLNSPRFDAVDVSHIILDSEGKAKEIFALLEEDPGCFAEMAQEHSLSADTAGKGGVIGKVSRGTLPDEIDAKIFSASSGDVLGPFSTGDDLLFEIFMVTTEHPAKLDNPTAHEVRKLIYREWLEARANEHALELL